MFGKENGDVEAASKHDVTSFEDNRTDIVIYIQNHAQDKIFQPIVCEGVQLSLEIKGMPGKLTFDVVKDNIIDFSEGNPVIMKVNGQDLFLGYVFTKSRNKDGIISVTAYDQLRYLKNKDVLTYENETASDVLKTLADKFKLKTGVIEDTEYQIPKRHESNVTLFDMIQTALDLTYEEKGKKKKFVLYDDFGSLTLRNINSEELKVPILIDSETAEDYNYETSIDRETFNRVKLFHDNQGEGERKVYIAQDTETQANWGVLQYCESINDRESKSPEEKAKTLLEEYNRKKRRLRINKAFGDIRVRAGSSVTVQLYLGDIAVNTEMVVESVVHRFEDNYHTMDLELDGNMLEGKNNDDKKEDAK